MDRLGAALRLQFPDGDPGGIDAGGDLFGAFAVAAMNHDRGALFRQHVRDRFTDAAAAAGDERAATLELQIHTIPILDVRCRPAPGRCRL